MDTIVNPPRTAALQRWLPVVLSIGSGLWLFGAAGLFIAAGGEPYLLFVAPIAAAPGVAQLVTGAPVRPLYSAAFFCVLTLFVFCVVTFIVFVAFAYMLAAPAVCLGVAWRLTRQRTPSVPQPVTSGHAE
ncbi:MAG: hypothetical protein FJW94_13515 [Actinobacteria bacterium]|nr:hypothetical protein [Actinomycetota bacterium]